MFQILNYCLSGYVLNRTEFLLMIYRCLISLMSSTKGCGMLSSAVHATSCFFWGQIRKTGKLDLYNFTTTWISIECTQIATEYMYIYIYCIVFVFAQCIHWDFPCIMSALVIAGFPVEATLLGGMFTANLWGTLCVQSMQWWVTSPRLLRFEPQNFQPAAWNRQLSLSHYSVEYFNNWQASIKEKSNRWQVLAQDI